MNRILVTIAVVVLMLLLTAAGYWLGVNTGRSKGYTQAEAEAVAQLSQAQAEAAVQLSQAQAEAEVQLEAAVEAAYARGYQEGYEEAVENPPRPEPECSIRIRGREQAGLLFSPAAYNIYLESNPTDFNNYYTVWRLKYDPSEYFFDAKDFDTSDEIKERCTLVIRTTPDTNSLIYSDSSASRQFDYVYFVSQDDGDWSNPVRFG